MNNATSTSFATMIWSPSAIRVSDAWNMSKGDLIEAGDPLSGGVGTRYNSGAGIQNLTASVEGAELLVGQAMTNIIFQYNASAINEAGLTWLESDIDANADGAESLFVADMDGDGDLDIVSASYLDDTIAWYENDGAANPSWTENVVATSADKPMSVHVADM
ncbi:MAG: FG-GAP repeat domain-containing protein, partial [Poseidonia sp.]